MPEGVLVTYSRPLVLTTKCIHSEGLKLSPSDKSAKRGKLRVARELSSVSQIHDELRDLILKGKFEPGARLSQIELAKQLRVGRTPLREALRMLQQEGLIVAEHNKRPRMLSFDPEVIDANSAEVILLFSLTATVSVPRLSDGEVATIRTSLDEMRQAEKCGDLDRWTQADIKFHADAFVHAGAPLAARVKRACDEFQYYLRFLVTRDNVQWDRIDAEHEAILDACAARNGDLVSTLTAGHFARGHITLLAHAMPDKEPRLIRAAMRLIVQKPELIGPRRMARA